MTMLYSQLNSQCPNWEAPTFSNSATIRAVIMMNEVQMGDSGDLLAAFDSAGNVRGIGIQIDPGFGPYDGQLLYELMIRSDFANDTIMQIANIIGGPGCRLHILSIL